MSDPTGTPGTPSFSSEKEYGPTTLTVKNIDGIHRVVSDQKIPTYMVKGPSLGTFVPKVVKLEPPKNYTIKPTIDGIQKGPTKAEVEALRAEKEAQGELLVQMLEIKDLMHIAEALENKPLSPKTLDLLTLTRNQVNAAFLEAYENPTNDNIRSLLESKNEYTDAVQQAEQEEAALPPEKTEAEKKAELQQEILKLSIDVDATLKEAVRLESQIQDDAIKQPFAVETANIELALTELKQTPDETAKEALELAFEEYKNNIDQIQQLIARQPKAASTPDEEKEVLRYVVSISGQVSDLVREAKTLENDISDAARLQDFKDKTADLEARFAILRQNPNIAGKNYFELLLTRYTQEIQSVKNFILANPIPAATPATTPVAGTPAATPAGPEALDIYSGWPSTIYKENTKTRKGWVFEDAAGTKHDLPNGIDWDKAKSNIEPVLDEFVAFLTKGTLAEQRARERENPELFELKDNIIEALLNKDIGRARGLTGALKASLAEKGAALQKREKDKVAERSEDGAWRAFWSEANSLNKKLEYFDLILEKEDLVILRSKLDTLRTIRQQLSDHNIRLKKGEEDEPRPELQAEYDRLLQELKRTFSELEVQHKEKLEEAIKKSELEKIKRAQLAQGQARLQKIQAQILPIPATLGTDEEKNRMIKPVGRPAMRMEEYVKEQEAKRLEANMMVITDDIDDQWPELEKLRKSGEKNRNVGDKVDKNWFKRFEIKTTYERMFNRDKDGFLSRYTNPVLDPATNVIRYVESPLLKAQNREWRDDSGRLIPGTYEIIKEILEEHGIIVERQNAEERKAEDNKKYEERQTMRAKYSETYHPYLKKSKGLFRKEDTGERLGYWSTEEMAKPSINLDTLASKYEKLKRERQKYLNHPANYRFGDIEQELDAQLAKARKEKQDGPKNVFKRDLFGGELKKFEKMLKNYEKEAGPLIHNQKEYRKLPQDPLERQKQADSNKRIEQITSKRLEHIERKTKGLSPRTKWALMIAPVVSTLAFVAYQKFTEGKGVTTDRVQKPTTISAPADTQDKKKGWEYAVYEKYKVTDISKSMEPEKGAPDYRPLLELVKSGTSGATLVERFVPSVVTKDKPNSAQDLLTKNAHRIYTEKGCYGLAEKQQEEICRLIEAFVNIGQAVGAPNREKGLYVESVMINPAETLGSYLQRITDMVQKAKK